MATHLCECLCVFVRDIIAISAKLAAKTTAAAVAASIGAVATIMVAKRKGGRESEGEKER